jgi:putative addiction module CopG family antidote
MATITVELTEPMKNFVDRKVQSGDFKNSSEVVQALLDVAIRAETRAKLDQRLLAGLDQIERGECSPWEPAEDRRVLQEMIRNRMVDAKK